MSMRLRVSSVNLRFVTSMQNDYAERLVGTSSDAAAQLVELRKAETFGVEDNHY